MGGRHGRVLVMCGPGNNGGDGFVIARQLRQTGFDVVVAYAGDEHPQATDAVSAWASWRAIGGVTLPRLPRGEYSLVIDALYGIGLTRPVEGEHAAWIDAVNRHGVSGIVDRRTERAERRYRSCARARHPRLAHRHDDCAETGSADAGWPGSLRDAFAA
jgi:hypothetical protein